LVKLEVII